ncbi:MAG: hypothetical protein ACKVU4_11730 [Phycisphaerales bacterium]
MAAGRWFDRGCGGPARVSRVLIVGAALAMPSPCSFGQSCLPHWSGQFTTGDTPNTPSAFTEYDDGTGTKLHAAGTEPIWVGRWDGDHWTYAALEQRHQGGKFTEYVGSMVSFDDGIGPRPALYVAGRFEKVKGVAASNIARWDGDAWSALGSGIQGWGVYTQCVFDDGSGPRLYVGGTFTGAGGHPGTGIARWDGAQWESVGSGAVGGSYQSVHAMRVHDDGAGPALFVGGDFDAMSGVPAMNIARWNGAWTPVGGAAPGIVTALETVADSPGRALYANNIGSTGPLAGFGMVRWDGANWSGVAGTEAMTNVQRIAVLDAGDGPALHAAVMYFTKFHIGGELFKRSGARWTAYGAGIATSALTAFDHGAGPRLHHTGFWENVPPVGQNITHGSRFRVFDAGAWTRFGPEGFQDPINTLEVIDLGAPALYAGGPFWDEKAIAPAGVLKWNGSGWEQLGPGTPRTVRAISRYNDGTGPTLYAGGDSWIIGKYSWATDDGALSRWTGTRWSKVPGFADANRVYALSVFSDGTQVGLYVGGEFTQAGGLPTGSIARWRQGQWSALGLGIAGIVRDLLVHDDGAGSSLFVAGEFTSAGGAPAQSIARWDGQAWHALGSGLYLAPGATQPASALTMVRYDEGSGSRLYVSGSFDRAGGVVAKHIARWDGQTWSPVGLGLTGPAAALRGFNDGTGSALYAAGAFGASTLNVRKWTGSTWVGVGGGTNLPASTMAVFNDGSGPGLWLGGPFVAARNRSSGRVAKWTGCPACFPDCSGDGALTVADFGCFQGKYVLGDLYADCNASGGLTVADFGCFQTKYVLGCP